MSAVDLANNSERSRDALLAKTEKLCNNIMDMRNDDPWGGNGYLSTILRAVRMQDASTYATDGQYELEPAYDYATSAQKELIIRDAAAGLIRNVQDLSTFVRDLQELWLFGGLDTLRDDKEQEQDSQKAIKVAEMLEQLVKMSPVNAEQNKVKSEKQQGEQ